MIEANATQGRVLAQFMYSELEKIARAGGAARSADDVVRGILGESLDDVVRAGRGTKKTLKSSPSAFRAAASAPFGISAVGSGIRQAQSNRALRKARSQNLGKLNDVRLEANRLLASNSPDEQKMGRALLNQVDSAKAAVLGTAPPKPAKVPKAGTKPEGGAPQAPKPSSLSQKFDRAANITGKAVIGGLGAAGAYSAYDAYQGQKNPYSSYQ